MGCIGTHRVDNPGLENGVWITGVNGGSQIPEARYVADRYWPRLINLPWGNATPFGTNVAGSRR